MQIRPGKNTRAPRRTIAAALATGLLGALLPTAAGAGTVLVSKSSTGVVSDSYSDSPAMSRDGRFVTFTSSASNLTATPTMSAAQLYLLDRTTSAVETVSVATSGDAGNNNSNFGALSDDGNVVAFSSTSSNLADDVCNLDNDDDEDCQSVYARNRSAGTTVMVSTSWNGDPADGGSDEMPGITADGRYVVFSSSATNLIPDDTNGRSDVFVRDLLTQTTTRISVDAVGGEANGHNWEPVISGDGRFVAFSTSATNLAPESVSAGTIIVVDRVLATIEARGTGGSNSGSFTPSISDDGALLTYLSYNALIPEDTNPSYDVYLEHRSTGVRTIVNADAGGAIAPNSDNGRLSPDGAFVLFRSGGQFVPDAGTGFSHLYRRRVADGTFTLVSRADDGRSVASPGYNPPHTTSADARFVAFSTFDGTLDANDTNGTYDIFVRDLATPEKTASGVTSADTDSGADGATYLDPMETMVVGPIGSSVSITQTDPTQTLPTGFTALGPQANVSVTPAGTVSEPISLTFRFDASILPAGADASSVHLFRNGVEVLDCTGAPSAVPDPCVSARSVLGDGDVSLTALSSAASAWNGAIVPPIDGTPPAIGVSRPTANGQYVQGSTVLAQYSCSDNFGPSGLLCVGDVPSGQPIDTSTVGPHTFQVTSTDAAGNTANASVSYSVLSDEFVRIGNATIVEGDTTNSRMLTFSVTLDHPADHTVTVGWSTAEGSAVPGEDYVGKSGTLKFKPSARTGVTATTKFVNVPIIGDTSVEDQEYFLVELANVTGGYHLAASTAFAVIVDDDEDAVGTRVGVGDASVWEGDVGPANTAKVWVTLSSPVTGPSPLSIRVTPVITATTPGVDHQVLKARTLTFKPGQWRKAVALKAFTDTEREPDENITMLLSDPSAGLTVDRAAGTFWINNDD